jgi:hypothetical protein
MASDSVVEAIKEIILKEDFKNEEEINSEDEVEDDEDLEENDTDVEESTEKESIQNGGNVEEVQNKDIKENTDDTTIDIVKNINIQSDDEDEEETKTLTVPIDEASEDSVSEKIHVVTHDTHMVETEEDRELLQSFHAELMSSTEPDVKIVTTSSKEGEYEGDNAFKKKKSKNKINDVFFG